MFFAARVKATERLRLTAEPGPVELTITHLSVEHGTEASLWLRVNLGPGREGSVLLAVLPQGQQKTIASGLRLKVMPGQETILEARDGEVHLIGQYRAAEQIDQHGAQLVSEIVPMRQTAVEKSEVKPIQRPRRSSRTPKPTTVQPSSQKRTDRKSNGGGKASGSSSLLSMVENIKDEDDSEEDDSYSEESESSSSSDSESEGKEMEEEDMQPRKASKREMVREKQAKKGESAVGKDDPKQQGEAQQGEASGPKSRRPVPSVIPAFLSA